MGKGERVEVGDSPVPPPVMTATMPSTLNKLFALRFDMEVLEVILSVISVFGGDLESSVVVVVVVVVDVRRFS